MAQAKFASITAGLLARKGDARPWSNHAVAKQPAWETGIPTAFVQADATRSAMPEPRPAGVAPEEPRKLTLRLSHTDYERLGIVATKRDITRQHLLRDLLERFLAEAAEDYRDRCACIGGACARDCAPPARGI